MSPSATQGVRVDERPTRERVVDRMDKIEEWVERSGAKIRADVAHDRLRDMGYEGSERTTRRAVAEVKVAYKAGRRRVHRPWVAEPGLWFQFDSRSGPVVRGVATVLFCAWLAWSRYWVVFPPGTSGCPR